MPLILVLTGGIVQLGTVMATQHTLTQIGRDVGRWAATQAADPCSSLADDDQPARRAHEIAVESQLMAYGGEWLIPTNFTAHPGTMPAGPPPGPGVEVAWEIVAGACPPLSSEQASFVTVRLAHEAPVLLPGLDLVLAQLPGLGTDGALLISTTATFRMEPQPEEAP